MDNYQNDKRFKELVRLYGPDEAKRIWDNRPPQPKKYTKAKEQREIRHAKRAKAFAKPKKEKIQRRTPKPKITSEELDKQLQAFFKAGGKIKRAKSLKKPKIQSKKIKKQFKTKIRNTKDNWAKRIKSFADNLEANLPKSEVWFRALYEIHFKHPLDKYNYAFKNRCIPDVINFHFKYVIEIDGSIHELESQKIKDNSKDKFYKEHGFQVFRVIAYNMDSYIGAIQAISRIRKQSPTKAFFDTINAK